MNNKNSFGRRAAVLCLAVALSACEQFDPAQSDDLMAVWTTDSLSLADGSPVSRWPNSSLARLAATATADSRPTYKIVDGVPLVHFDGADDFMSVGTAADWNFLSDGSPWTVFVVFRPDAGEPAGKYVLLDSGGADADNSGFAISYDGSNSRRSNGVRLSVTPGDSHALALDMATGNRALSPGQWGIISATFKPRETGAWGWGEASLFVNGYRRGIAEAPLPTYESAAQTALNIGRYGLGGEFLAKGDVKEIMIYSRAMSEEEQYETIQYLAGKLGTQIRVRNGPAASSWLNPNPEEYQAFGIAFRIPSSGKLVAIQRQGTTHVGGTVGAVRQWESTDRGATWKSKLTYDSQYDDRGVAGGLVPRSQSVVIFFARYDGANWIDMRGLRSVDNARTFQDVGALPTNGCSMFIPYGPMIELPSGRLLQTFYGDIAGTNKVWISESVDDGRTWTYKSDIYVGPLKINETSLAWVSGADDATSTLVAVSRNDAGSGLLQYVSTNGGDTWTSQGLIPGGVSTDVSPWVYRMSDGTLVNAWHERSWFTFRVRTGLATEVAANPSSWGPMQVTYQATTRVVGDSGYPALLSATGWDDDLIQVMYDASKNGKPNLLINPIFLP